MTAPKEPAYKKHIGYQGGLLGGFATLAAAFIVIGNIATHDAIEQRKADDLQRSLNQVIPPALHDNNVLKDQVTLKHEGKNIMVYRGTLKQKPVAFAFNISGQGYGGEISILMGVDNNGKILGVRILSHTETPGLGDKIEAEKSHWVYNFNNLSFNKVPMEKWRVKKDGGIFDQFSGATITPRAVIKAVTEGLSMFNSHRHELIAPTSTQSAVQDKTEEITRQTASTETATTSTRK